MTRTPAGLAVALGLILTAPCRAAAPEIKGTTPLGVPKGVETEITVNGANLAGNPRLVAPFAFVTVPPSKPGDTTNASLKLIVAPATPIGIYPVRIQTDHGISNPLLFAVGQLPQVAEKEDNNSFETAQAITAPVIVEGQAAGNDVDFYRFAGKKGQRIVVDAQCSRMGSGVDPTIRLTTANRTYVASADDSPGLITDARLTTTLPEDTDYVIEISDSSYKGTGRAIYRLLVGAVPMAEEIYPLGGRHGQTLGLELRGGTLTDVRIAAATVKTAPGSAVCPVRLTTPIVGDATAGGPLLEVESLPALDADALPELHEPVEPAAAPLRAAIPVALNGRIDPAGDEDRFTLVVTPGQALRIEVRASEKGSALDGVLQILGAKDAVVATADDTTVTPAGAATAAANRRAAAYVLPDPSLNFTVPAGSNEITLALRDLESRGGVGFPYRITVTPVTPTFELSLADSEVNVPKRGAALVGVTVVRKGYNGPITLSVANPPPGLWVRPGRIADGQLVGTLSLAAASDARFEPFTLEVVGRGEGTAAPIVVTASKTIVFATHGTLPTNSLIQHGLAAATTVPPAIAFDVPAGPVDVVHGYGVPITVNLARAEGAEGELAVSSLPLPPGLAIPAVKLGARDEQGKVTVNAAVETAIGPMTIGLTAKGKFDKVEQTFAMPAVTLNVIRPAAIELAAPSFEARAGATTELKGKIVRHGPFKEPVTVKLSGLPAGLKAEPVKVAPDQSAFVVPIVADAKAAAAQTSANVSMAFQVNKKDYTTPPSPLTVKVVPAK